MTQRSRDDLAGWASNAMNRERPSGAFMAGLFAGALPRRRDCCSRLARFQFREQVSDVAMSAGKTMSEAVTNWRNAAATSIRARDVAACARRG